MHSLYITSSFLQHLHVWLGGLFIPEAFITASRQYVSQANEWSLEELQLEVTVGNPDDPPPEKDDSSFLMSGMAK